MFLGMPRFGTLVCLLLAFYQAGHSHVWGQQTSPPVANEKAVVSEGASNMREIESPIVKITAAESASHDLPPAEITLNTGKLNMSGSKFSLKDEYFTLSGPPGGPLGLVVIRVAKAPKELADWKQLIAELYKDRFPEAGTVGKAELDGKPHPAFTCTTDKGFARSHHLLILIAVPKSDQGVLIDFYSGADKTKTPTPQEMAKQGDFLELSPSFSIRFE